MRLFLLILTLSIFPGCSAIDMKQYGNNEPPLDIFDYFQGTTTGWGIVQDRNGNLTRQFKVTIKGSIIKTIERRIGT